MAVKEITNCFYYILLSASQKIKKGFLNKKMDPPKNMALKDRKTVLLNHIISSGYIQRPINYRNPRIHLNVSI